MHKIVQEAPKKRPRRAQERQNAKKVRKVPRTLQEEVKLKQGQSPRCPTWPPLREGKLIKVTLREGKVTTLNMGLSNTRRGGDPRVLRPLRGDRRIPFGFRHVPLEAASVESSGVQWSTANYVELTLNFNKSRLCQKSSKK